jgi:hypothetical protein
MKASELIAILQKDIELHGDGEVQIPAGECPDSYTGLERVIHFSHVGNVIFRQTRGYQGNDWKRV